MSGTTFSETATLSQRSKFPGSRDVYFQSLETRNSSSTSLDIMAARPRSQFGQEPISPGISKIINVWEKCREDHKAKKKLNETVPRLYETVRDVLTEAIDEAIDTSHNNLEIENQIKQFFGDRLETQQKQAQKLKGDNEIDDCVLWIVLWMAVVNYGSASDDYSDGSEKTANMRIIHMIIDRAPWLAFDNPYKSPHKDIDAWEQYRIKERCKYSNNHNHKARKWDLTPFHEAAANDNSEAVEYMIQTGLQKLQLDDSPETRRLVFIQVLQQPSPDSKTALSLSAATENGGIRVLKVLLDFYKENIHSGDTTFRDALDEGRADVVKAFLRHVRPETIVTTDNISQAIQVLSKEKDRELRQSRQMIVSLLISHVTKAEVLNQSIIERIIQLNLKDILEDKMKSRAFIMKDFRPLHLAVRHQNPEFVEMFLEYYPDLITEEYSGHYPLWHNNYKSEDNRRCFEGFNEVNKRIRDMIVTATIKSRKIDKMEDLLEIFQTSGETVNELCFDISRFNSKVYPVSDFIRSLVGHQDDRNLLSYEQTIRYVEFPALDLKEKEAFGDNVQSEHFEVFQALDWLHKKGVREILKLTIPDRLVNPHNEVGIGIFVERFKVEVLDWRFLDMSISTLKRSKQRIRELHLYASGKRSAIMHWLSKEGVRSLTNLTKLEIHVIQELMSKESRQTTTKFLDKNFGDLCRRVNEGRKKKRNSEPLILDIKIEAWNPTIKRLADLEEISDRAVPKLSKFIGSYHSHVHGLVKDNNPAKEEGPAEKDKIEFRPTRVALIDNGILSISPKTDGLWELPTDVWHFDDSSNSGNTQNESTTQKSHGLNQGNASSKPQDTKHYKNLWSRIKEGRSFVEEDSKFSSWLFASNPHGTQMANLICAIDPWCDLYVAKVTEGRYGIRPERVEKAIQWAIDRKVDIISMSFAILDTTDSLADVCDKAMKAGIVLICSTHDEGANISTAYPASFNGTIKITACDEFGAPARNMTQGFDYTIQGQEVAAGVVPFLESDDRISGSSVATAIAAGLSSLTLSCDRLAKKDPYKNYGKSGRSDIIREHFQKMLAEKSEKYILPEKFAGVDKKLKDWTNIDAEDIIEEFFAAGKEKV